jgi:TrpR-related protein YerC/YecD
MKLTPFTPQLKSGQTDLLMKALLTLNTPEEAHRFCEDVMTIKELESIAQRLEVAVMLSRKATYQEIAQKTGASTATISRVNRSLHYGADGYTFVLAQLDKEVSR